MGAQPMAGPYFGPATITHNLYQWGELPLFTILPRETENPYARASLLTIRRVIAT